MAESLTCFACEREPTQQCPRCGRPYCDEHGEELCDICMQPSGGVPSFTLYRGSLLALLIGTALAVWLLVQPPGNETSAAVRSAAPTAVPTAAAAATNGQQTPTVRAGTQQPASTQPAGTASPSSTTSGATTTPAATATTSGGSTYVVRSGDTLSGICSLQRPALGNVDCVSQLQALNNISGESLDIGQTLRLP